MLDIIPTGSLVGFNNPSKRVHDDDDEVFITGIEARPPPPAVTTPIDFTSKSVGVSLLN